MDVYDAARTVLAVRAYLDRPIPAEIVQKIIESAWLTGSSRNGQPWHFIVIENRETLKELAPGRGRRHGAIPLLRIGCQPGHPNDDPDRLVGGDRFELGRFP